MVEYYKTSSGKMPVYEFLNNLPVKMRAKAFRGIELLEELGPQIKKPYSKQVKDGIYELRIRFGSDTSRIFYFFYTGRKIILTNGFIKKTKKMTTNEFDKALRYKADYERRFPE